MYKIFVYSRKDNYLVGSYSVSDISHLQICLNVVLDCFNPDAVYIRVTNSNEKKK